MRRFKRSYYLQNREDVVWLKKQGGLVTKPSSVLRRHPWARHLKLWPLTSLWMEERNDTFVGELMHDTRKDIWYSKHLKRTCVTQEKNGSYLFCRTLFTCQLAEPRELWEHGRWGGLAAARFGNELTIIKNVRNLQLKGDRTLCSFKMDLTESGLTKHGGWTGQRLGLWSNASNIEADRFLIAR